MAALRLYFAIISDELDVHFSVHRDLSTLKITWQDADRSDSVGIIHVGFVRPKIRKPAELLKFRGGILVSVAAKWSFPDEYRSSVAIVAELNFSKKTIPLHQLLSGLGVHEPEPNAAFISSRNSNLSKSDTVVAAALSVLNAAEKPLSKEEIFARAVEQGLYEFSGKKPVSSLAVELNKYSTNSNTSDPSIEPLFNMLDGDLFCSLSNDLSEMTGWVQELSIENNGLSGQAAAHGIYSEESYLLYANALPSKVRNQLELYRFESLLKRADQNDPAALINIIPSRLATANVNSLGFPIRIVNVLTTNSIGCLDEMRDVPVDEMLEWPNFGRKSVRDFCSSLISYVEKMRGDIDLTHSFDIDSANREFVGAEEGVDKSYQREIVSLTPLKVHFEKALSELKDNQRQVIECRTGYSGHVMTLEAVGELLGVTRERIRQIQKKYVNKIIKTEFWDDCIALKIGQLLIDRTTPLYIEMLELEDPWFEGFMGNYQHLCAIIELFSENEIRVIKLSGASFVTRIKADAWEKCVTQTRSSLKDKAEEGSWSRHDVETTIRTILSENGGAELLPLMWAQFEDSLLFDGEEPSSKLIGFGRSAEAAIAAVLAKAESPLHYTEIARRASEIYGREVNERIAHNAAQRLGGKLYGRGKYGLAHHNPISERMCKNIQLVVSNMILNGPLMKQWHCGEIYTQLKERFPALPQELDHYTLNIILGEATKLEYLNRMVWARADSGQLKGDRVDVADAFTKILEEHGGPLKGAELKDRLANIRGVVENLQIHGTDRMIQLGPDYWGLIERDIIGSEEANIERLDALYQYLTDTQIGIHVSEVEDVLAAYKIPGEAPESYALLNLAQRDPRFYLAKAMLMGLAEWGGDTRRLNQTQAVKELFEKMEAPLSIGQIHIELGRLTGLVVDGAITGLLINQGFVYDSVVRRWFK